MAFHTTYRLVVLVSVAGSLMHSTVFSSPRRQESSDTAVVAKPVQEVWSPDNGDGTYTNPVIYADYSDPDVIRVGNNFYMTSSSFAHFPGLPILHSNDLVNWSIIGHAIAQYPIKAFDAPQHGNGVWAPSIRFHGGEYYIYFGDPDNGIFMTKARDPAGPWDSLVLVREAKGWIDPCPLWDDDGNVYLVHAWAKSRASINSMLTLNKMNAEGTRVLDGGVTIFDGRIDQPTIEGPKIYKRDGYYYIFAPAGGVKSGWQTVLRSRALYGPYEAKVVLEQGTTRVNGPHQGAWVETAKGESWFMHFQDRNAYGRIVYLEPMHWVEGWPMIGVDLDKNGVGEPVACHRKPNVGQVYPIRVPATSDEFSSDTLGLQWQWESNPDSDWCSLDARRGWLRLFPQSLKPAAKNLWGAGNIVDQKIPGPQLLCETCLDCSALVDGDEAGLLVLGVDYSYVAVRRTPSDLRIVQVICRDADRGNQEEVVANSSIGKDRVILRLRMEGEGRCDFGYSLDGRKFRRLGNEFVAKAGKWVGAKIGLFAVQLNDVRQRGFADCDWVRFRPSARVN
jgi:beta-xylosidase